MTSRAADLGFDWERDSDVAKKIEEEIEEWREAAAQGDRQAEEKEIGDLLLSVVNLARRRSIDPEAPCGGPTRDSARDSPASPGGPPCRAGRSQRFLWRSWIGTGRKPRKKICDSGAGIRVIRHGIEALVGLTDPNHQFLTRRPAAPTGTSLTPRCLNPGSSRSSTASVAAYG